jgi:signal transduction histidine kinase
MNKFIKYIRNIKNYFTTLKVKIKLFIIFSLLNIILTCFVSLYFPELFNDILQEEIESKSKSISLMTSTNIASAVDFEDMFELKELLEATYINTNIEYLIVENKSKTVIYSRNLEKAQSCSYTDNVSDALSKDGLVFQTITNINTNGRTVGKLYIGFSLTSHLVKIHSMQELIIIIGLIILILGFTVSYFLSSYFVKPLSDISSAFLEISTEDLSKRIKIITNDEIGNLSKAFNIMLDKLEKANNEMKILNNSLEIKNIELKDLNLTKDKFFSIIAHDLRSPISAFCSVTTMLYDNSDDFTDEERLDFLSLIKNSAQNVYSLLENLLQWSRSQRGLLIFNPEIVNLEKVIVNVLSLHKQNADNKSIQIIKNVPQNLNVFVDISMLNTILRNLISNAIKFTMIGGKIEIGIIEKEISDNLNSDDGNIVTVYVKDSGIGIDELSISKLFKIDESITTKGTSEEEGTGLGLILCKEFVELNGGRIWVESEVGVGTTCYFNIPLYISNN